ncbi:kinesin-like protein KIF3A isoform X2 [Lepeophtheirus salmonis]|uniref:kinesin-like protein KIF3A isoform X2 n=1 Tax=Lepeophtheirus salmonis TaxID=72036 RepID=UPI001AE6A9BB|nr:kinesin-like protein KIF12 isoform X2 [Lepeophtheirus salmonis]
MRVITSSSGEEGSRRPSFNKQNRFTKNPRLQRKIRKYSSISSSSTSSERFNNISSYGKSILGSSDSLVKSSSNGGVKSDYSGDDNEGDNINVVVRVRPLNIKEHKQNDTNIIHFPGDGGVWVDEQKRDKIKPYTFNVVFEPEATQEDILDHSGIKKLIDMAVDGFSTTVFCYGQTGSGKTHTLTGPPDLFRARNMDPNHKDHGLVFRSFLYLYQQLDAKSESANFRVKASYLEIYNEKVIDLLNPGTKRSNLAVRWNKKSRAHVVDNLFSIECDELEDLLAVLEEGLRNRAIGTHNMNEHSSRSHTILTVYIQSEEKAVSENNNGVFITRHGKINFVDLAGSEMTKKTKSEGKTLEEANNINKSLMVLGYCIAQLSNQKKTDRILHVPYRDSKLTKLLADSLAGNGVTLMIACVSPAKSNLSETSNTLRYAARAKKIKTKPVIVMDPREALIVSLKREVAILQQENGHLRQLLELGDLDERHDNSAVSYTQTDQHLMEVKTPLDGRASPSSAKKVNKSQLGELDPNTVLELVKDYMKENADLRKENTDLFSVRDMLLRDQELVCRENERLLKKLEDVNSVCCRSPIIPARPSYSAELLSMSLSGSLPRSSGVMGSAPEHLNSSSNSHTSPVTNVWVNPMMDTPPPSNYENGHDEDVSQQRNNVGSCTSGRNSPSFSHSKSRLPENINRELERRKIGNSMTNIVESYRKSRSFSKGGSLDSESGDNSEFFSVYGRKKPGLIKDSLSVSRGSIHSSPEEQQIVEMSNGGANIPLRGVKTNGSMFSNATKAKLLRNKGRSQTQD